MTGLDFATIVREKTRTTSTTLTDAYLLSLMNSYKDSLVQLVISEVKSDYFAAKYTRDLVEDLREYALPRSDTVGDKVQDLISVEAKLGDNWLRLKKGNMFEKWITQDETSIRDRFDNMQGRAFYAVVRDSIFILSGKIEETTGGLVIWTESYPANWTTDILTSVNDLSTPTTTSRGFPKELHMLLVDLVVIDIKSTAEKPIPLTENERYITNRKREVIRIMRNRHREGNDYRQVPNDDIVASFDNGYNL